MKIKSKKQKALEEEETLDNEETTDTEEEEGEEGEEGEGEGETKELGNFIDKKLDNIIKAIADNAVKSSLKLHKGSEDVVLSKSIMQTDSALRKTAPFVQLSPKMEKFVKHIKDMAKGDIGALAKAMNEGNDDDGGFTVPEEFTAEVVRYNSEVAIVRPRARVWNMTRDIYNAPKLDQNFSSDGDDFAGVSFTYDDESDTATASQPRFGKVKLQAKKLRGLTAITDELLEDSAVNIANFLVSLFGEAMAWVEDKNFLQGNGVGKPLGIINAADVNVVTRDTAATVKLADLFAMRKALRPMFRENSVWVMNRNAEDAILQINASTTEGVKLLGNLVDGVPTTLLGRPFIVTDKLPQVAGNKGDIILGDFSRYYIGDRGAMKVTSSIHDRFREDETSIKFVKRHDGQPAIHEAFVVLSEKL